MSSLAKRWGLSGGILLILGGVIPLRGQACAFPISRQSLAQTLRAGLQTAARQVSWPFRPTPPQNFITFLVNFRSAIVRVEINSPKSAVPVSLWVRSHAEGKEIFDEIRWELKTYFDLPLLGLLNLHLNDQFYPVYTVNDFKDRPVMTGSLRVGSGIPGREFYRLDMSFPNRKTAEKIAQLVLARRYDSTQGIARRFATRPAIGLVAREFPLALHLFQLSRKSSVERIEPRDLDRLLYIVPELPAIGTHQRPETLRMLHLIRQVDWENENTRRELTQFLEDEEMTFGKEFPASGVPLLAEKLGKIKKALFYHFPNPGQWEEWLRQNIENSTDRIFTY